MKLVVLTLFFVAAFSLRSFHTPDYSQTEHHERVFEAWKHHYNVKYKSTEIEGSHYSTFVSNWEYISKFNENPSGNFTLGLNQFAAMTSKQFRIAIHGSDTPCLTRKQHKESMRWGSGQGDDIKANPSSVDWTTKGVVTPVKNQGQCGSCWAFSTTGSIESRTAISTGKLVSLSEQQLVDCSDSYGNKGCQGGLMDDAFKYVKANGGLCSESEYPYKGKNGKCEAANCKTKYDSISGYHDVTPKNEPDLETAVASGPVSIAIQANQLQFQLYFGGIMSFDCGTQLDHGVLVVGYQNSGDKYWKVKNSWGGTWGESGYFRLCKECNKNSGAGECGILEEPSYPLV